MGRNQVSFNGKFLAFDTEADFTHLYNQLALEMENNSLYIESILGNESNEDNIYTLYVQNDLNENLPLEQFEKSLNFQSLRKDLFEKETLWLSQQTGDSLDLSLSPDNHKMIDPILRTLYNADGEVMIAGKIYRIQDWGIIKFEAPEPSVYYQDYFENSTCSELVKIIRDSSLNGFECSSYISPVCKTRNYYDKSFYYNNNSRKYRIRGSVDFGFNYSSINARTTFYKKIAGGWFHRPAIIQAIIFGEGNKVFKTVVDCDGEEIWVERNERRRRADISASYILWGSYHHFRIKRNDITNIHRVWDTNTKVIDLYNGSYL